MDLYVHLGIYKESWYTHGIVHIVMLLARTHGVVMDSWYRHGLKVLTTPMVLTHDIALGSIEIEGFYGEIFPSQGGKY